MTSRRMLVALLLLFSAAKAQIARIPVPEVPGWTRTADSAVYTPQNLWDFIDGAAETYLLYAFQELAVCEFAGAEGCTVRVEVYRHASPTMAFGIYATERQPEYRWVDVGTEGYQEEGVLNFLAGLYYCKLTSHNRGERTRLGMLELARAVDAALGGSRGWPDGLRYLPAEGKVLHTEGFIPSDILGYSFLKEGFTASYGGGARLYAIRAESPASARQLAERYAALSAAQESPSGTWRVNDQNNGAVCLLLHGRLLYAVVNASTSGTAQITRAITVLPD